MQISISRRGRRLVVLTCTLAALVAAAGPAEAAPVVSHLRVEAGGAVLADASFPTDTQSFTTDIGKPGCGGTGQVKSVAGPTALGLLGSASPIDADLRPLRISDKFSFGLLVCGVGSAAASDTAFWLYKVNHLSPEVGGDAFKLKGGEEVLWFFQDTARKRNTGDELVVDTPARARPGEVEVTVSAYSFNGARRPAAGAKVFFGDTSTVADGNGKARMELTKSMTVRAGRAGDIPSAPERVCVSSRLKRCPSVRGKLIYGTDGADRLKGTPGGDLIRAGGGSDRIDVRGGNDDRVRCGKGSRDRVRTSAGDRVTRDCEIVNGRRRVSAGG